VRFRKHRHIPLEHAHCPRWIRSEQSLSIHPIRDLRERPSTRIAPPELSKHNVSSVDAIRRYQTVKPGDEQTER